MKCFLIKIGKHPVRKHAVLSLYLYTSIETQNNHELLTSWWRHQRELHFHDINKRATFAFLARYIRELSWSSSIACVASVLMRRVFSASRLRARANTSICALPQAVKSSSYEYTHLHTARLPAAFLVHPETSTRVCISWKKVVWWKKVVKCLYFLTEILRIKIALKLFVCGDSNWNYFLNTRKDEFEFLLAVVYSRRFSAVL